MQSNVINLNAYRGREQKCLRCKRPWTGRGWCHQCTDRLRGALNKQCPKPERCAGCRGEINPRARVAHCLDTGKTWCSSACWYRHVMDGAEAAK